ncbi:MAG: PilZ domain-containing protein [Deltaproteobacteria bacterium]|nr:PilZ domain-containing protein [Deltaproteobacteria bacterium]
MSLVDQPGHPFLGLYDISSGGVSVVADPRRHHFEVEDRMNGQVHMPGEIPLAVELEVRHSRDFPRQSNLRIYGTRITQISKEHEHVLAEFLTHWHRAGGVV